MPSSASLALIHAAPGPGHRRPTVVIVQRHLRPERLAMFDRLRRSLERRGVGLRLLYSPEPNAAGGTAAEPVLTWAEPVAARQALGGLLCWQDARQAARDADLVIAPQENRLLFNYVLPLLRPAPRWALWGHGRNFQAAGPGTPAERFKRWFSRRPDWWFAYTERSAEVVRGQGYPRERITVLNNAQEMEAARERMEPISVEGEGRALHDFGIQPGPVGLLLGALSADKRIGFALEAAQRVRQQVPGFQLVVVGDGPQRAQVEAAVKASQPQGGWVRWLGPRTGADKAALLRRAELLLNPGAVGLVMLDSFVAGTPVVTCQLPNRGPTHGPESAYLRHGVNGWVARDDVGSFSNAVCWLLNNGATRKLLHEACLRDAEVYTLDAMVEHFTRGILACLAAPPGTGEAGILGPGTDARTHANARSTT